MRTALAKVRSLSCGGSRDIRAEHEGAAVIWNLDSLTIELERLKTIELEPNRLPGETFRATAPSLTWIQGSRLDTGGRGPPPAHLAADVPLFTAACSVGAVEISVRSKTDDNELARPSTHAHGSVDVSDKGMVSRMRLTSHTIQAQDPSAVDVVGVETTRSGSEAASTWMGLSDTSATMDHRCSSLDAKFPMWVISVDDALDMEQIRVHESLMKSTLLLEKDDSRSTMFVSQCWLSAASPDHGNKKWSLLKDLLRGAMVGNASFSPAWYDQIFMRTETASGNKLRTWARTGFVWFDYCSIPQFSAEDKLLAVMSIPYYISSSDWFVVIQPAAQHENGLDYDIRTWASRGWCRLERAVNALSPNPKVTLAVESKGLLYIQSSREWLLNPVGRGQFTVESDRKMLGPVLDEVISRRQRAAFDQQDALWHRMLHVIRDMLMDGTGWPTPPPLTFGEWMEKLWFKTAQDEKTSGRTPLRFAMYDGRLDIAQELLSRGASVHAPLNRSAHQWGWHVGGLTILGGLCVMRDFPEGVAFLIEHKADPYKCDRWTGTSVAGLAAQSGQVATVDLLMRRQLLVLTPGTNEESGFFSQAILAGHLAVVQCIMEGCETLKTCRDQFGNHGHHPNFREWKAGLSMCCAAVSDAADIEVLSLLLDYGYSIDSETNYSKVTWSTWITFNMKVQAAYLAGIADDNLAEYVAHVPLNAVRQAVMKGHVKAVKLCIEVKADLTTAGGLGRTCLHLAALKGHTCIVELLLEASAPVGQRDVFGHTASALATGRGYIDVAKVLIEHGDESACTVLACC